MSLHRRLLILLAFFCCNAALLGQGGIIWEEATPICDPNSTSTFISLPPVESYDRNVFPASIEPCNSYFSFNLNNPAWYTLQATSTNISMDISITNCVGTGHGIGVQYALVEVVDGVPVPINCNSDANLGDNNSFSTSDLTVGTTYYLVLDGFAESTCEYSISNSIGFDNPQITDRVTQLIVNGAPNTNSGCRRNDVVRVSAVDATNNPITNANSYMWEVSSLSGNGFSEFFDQSDNTIDIENIPAGDYQAIVRVGNACDSGTDYTLDFTVEENPLDILPAETVCLERFSQQYTPMNPDYRGGPLTGIPSNPTRDTFFVEVGTGSCPEIQVLPINFVNGINTPTRPVDTTTCDPRGVMLSGVLYGPRAEGSLPHYVPLDGDCGGIIELKVTLFFLSGDIEFDECDTRGATLFYKPGFEAAFNDVKQFASYSWKDADGNEVSNQETYQAETTGQYSLTIEMQKGNNPVCSFDIPPRTVTINSLNDLDLECGATTPNSIDIQWNGIQDVDEYAVGVDGRIVAENITDGNYTFNDVSLGESVNFFVFAVSDDPNCAPLQDSVTCQAQDCPPVELQIIDLSTNTEPDSISYCVDNTGANVGQFEIRVTNGTPTGQGRWIIRGGGSLDGDRNSDQIEFNADNNRAGTYQLGYQYEDGDCEIVLDRDSEVYLEVVIPPISTDLVRPSRLEFSDGVCVNEVLEFRYDGNAGRDAIPIFTGDINNTNISGNLNDGFEVTFTTTGVKNFTFMISDDNGCNSMEEPYSIEVGDPLVPQLIICDIPSPSEGLRFSWPDQPCVEEYRIWIDGTRQSPDVTVPEFIYTRAAIGRTYEIEVVAVSDCGCGTTSFTAVTCPFEPLQLCGDVTVDLALPAADTLVCIEAGGIAPVLELMATVTGQDQAIGVEVWEVDSGNMSISPTGEFDPNVAGLGIHQVKYIWTEGDCVYQDSINLIITDAATVNFEIEVLDPMCFGEDMGTINIDVSGDEKDFGVYINDDAIGSKDTSFMLPSGMHFVTVIDSLTGCDTLAAVDIAEGPDSLFLFPADEYFARGEDDLIINLDSTFATTIDSLDWIFNNEVICDDLVCGEDFLFTPQESGTLCFVGYYSESCVYTECAEVTYFPEFMVYYPNVISLSSNALPENQTFQIYTNDPDAIVQKLYIFDRWGNAMYQNSAEGTIMSWDPRLNKSSQGVYAYYIEIMQADGKVSSHSGTITVIK